MVGVGDSLAFYLTSRECHEICLNGREDGEGADLYKPQGLFQEIDARDGTLARTVDCLQSAQFLQQLDYSVRLGEAGGTTHGRCYPDGLKDLLVGGTGR